MQAEADTPRAGQSMATRSAYSQAARTWRVPLERCASSSRCFAVLPAGMRLQVRPPSPVQRTQHAARATVEDMRVDLRRRHVLVPEQLLDRPDIRTALQQVGGKAV